MSDYGGFRQQIANMGMQKPDAYNPYAAGSKVYGAEGRANPTSGPVDKAGYAVRDRAVKAKRQALLQRMQAAQTGNYMSSDYLLGEPNGA
jgi:hypothetical protein